ncbi:Cia1 [Hexamita inflata]|uniref:Cia1 n=1 Tax=Hexamita inflata TaxID=28002 RepID=A0AA86QA78_9EUKA|nr:Cia1 [Hexamita inflata]
MKLVKKIQVHNDRIWHACFSQNNQFLATCCADGQVNLYSADYKLIQQLPHPATVRQCCFSDDSTKLYVACYNCNLYVYALEDNEFKTFAILEKAHSKEIKSVAVQRKFIATCARDRCVHIWKTNQMYEDDYDCISVLQTHTQDIKSVFFGQKQLCSVGYDNTICLYNEQFMDEEFDYQLKAIYKSPVGPEEETDIANEIGCTVWSGVFNDQGIVVVDQLGYISLLQLDNDKLVIKAHKKIHSSAIYKVIKSGLGYVTAGQDGSVKIINNQFEIEWELKGHIGEVNSVATNGKDIVSVGDDGMLYIWNW